MTEAERRETEERGMVGQVETKFKRVKTAWKKGEAGRGGSELQMLSHSRGRWACHAKVSRENPERQRQPSEGAWQSIKFSQNPSAGQLNLT